MKNAIIASFILAAGLSLQAQQNAPAPPPPPPAPEPQQRQMQQNQMRQGAPAMPMQPMSEVVEYTQLKFKFEVATEKVTDVVLSNGMTNENINREFKSIVDVLNFVGHNGWSYISEEKKDANGITEYSMLFSRKMALQNRMSGSNQPAMQGQPNRPSEEEIKKRIEEMKKKKEQEKAAKEKK